MKYKGIIFDFNGVLWWDVRLQSQSWKEYSSKIRGYPLTEEEMSVHVHGRNNRHTLSYLIGHDLEGEELFEITQGKESKYRELCLAEKDNFKLSPGATQFLDYLKSHQIPRTIATASEKDNVDFFVTHLHLDRWFDVSKIVYNDGILPGKPEPDIYLKACANLDLEPNDCIVIEDAKSGIQSARVAGIGKIIALGPKSKHKALLTLEGVSEVVEDLSQIKPGELFF